MGHSELLRMKIDLAGGAAPEALSRLWRHPRVAELFPEFLILLHQIVRASVPVMKAALGKARECPEDELSARLVPYLVRHIEEERDHDLWLLDDLASAGWPPSKVLARTPAPTVANLVGAQYYWTLHHHPVALFGYMRVLEGAPPSVAHIDMLREQTRLPSELFRTYGLHAVLDPGHRTDIDEVLDVLPLTASHAALLGLSAINTIGLFQAAVEDLLASPEAVSHERQTG